MHLRLPALSNTQLPSAPTALVADLDWRLAAGLEGYVEVELPGEVAVLFLHKGRTYCAGRMDEDGRFGALSLPRFFASLDGARSVTLCETDLPLFLCTAVLFRKAPAAQIPSSLVDSAAILDQLREAGRDAVLVIRRGGAKSLVFCREGVPMALYPGPGSEFPEADTVTDRIVEYVYAGDGKTEVTLDLYDEISLPPAPEAGQPVSSYRLDLEDDGPEITLEVRLGGRVVFAFPMFGDEITIGRGGDNDLALDNLSVSRRHARVRRVGERLDVADLGSENGLKVDGEKVEQVTLGPGDEVGIGRYTLVFRLGPGAGVPAPPPKRPAVAAVEETIAIDATDKVAEIEHAGEVHKMGGWVFTIGRKGDASLRIRGLWVGGIHARINRDPDGRYQVEHVAGLSSLKVNDRKVERAQLEDGDELAIGSRRFRFRLRAR